MLLLNLLLTLAMASDYSPELKGSKSKHSNAIPKSCKCSDKGVSKHCPIKVVCVKK